MNLNRIKFLREERDMSLNDLMDSLMKEKGVKISRASLNNYERGEQTPKTETWSILADFFNVDIQYIMGLSPIRNSVENKFYEYNLSSLVDLIDQNGENVTSMRKSLSLFVSILRHIQNDASSLNELSELLSSISQLTGDADSFTFDDDGNYLTNREIIKNILHKKREIDKNISAFIDLSIDTVPEYSSIQVDASSLFSDKEEQNDYLGKLLTDSTFEEFLEDEQKKEQLRKKLDEKIQENLKKIEHLE